jgi:hypothetical protein
MEIQDYLKFEYLNISPFSFIILSPILKNYEYFLYFISIYQALILNKILSTYVLIVLIASPNEKHWSSHARVSFSCFRRI